MVGTRRQAKRKAAPSTFHGSKTEEEPLSEVSSNVTTPISSPKKKRKKSASLKLPKSPALEIKSELSKRELIDMDNVSLTGSDDSEDDETGMSALERKMRENVQDNADFFSKLGIGTAKLQFEETQEVKKPRPTYRGLKEKKVKEVLPRRQSLRIQNRDPEGGELPEKEPTELFSNYLASPYEVLRKSGPLKMDDVLTNGDEDEAHNKFFDELSGLSGDHGKDIKMDKELSGFVKSMENMQINEYRVAKVVPQRIFSIAIHPTNDKVLIAAGDKWGKVGFWDVSSRNNQDGVYCYAPHVRPVKYLSFPKDQQDRLYSCSYDGSLRCCQFDKEIFDEIYATPEDEDIMVTGFDFFTPTNMVISQGKGGIVMLDTRNPKKSTLHEVIQKTVRGVSIHPLQNDYIATAHADTTVSVWDVRKLDTKKPKSVYTLSHTKIVESAFFSPVTGKHLVTTAMDDRIRLYDTSVVGKEANILHSVRHNNHTGRWLSKFRAVWHPSRDDVFICGSMNRPRQIEMFNSKGQIVKLFKNEDFLCSVCSLNAFHPTRNILVGGNSSGRVHVFM